MRLTMRERKAVAKVLRMRYRRASKTEKGQLLDELVGLTGYHRCYAAGVLGGQGARAEGLRGREERRARQRPRVYDEAVRSVLRQVWLIMDCICGKRLAILAKGEDYDPQAWRRWSPTAAQIAVAALGDAAEMAGAARGVFLGRQPEPGS